jgi:hypothetical protein
MMEKPISAIDQEARKLPDMLRPVANPGMAPNKFIQCVSTANV